MRLEGVPDAELDGVRLLIFVPRDQPVQPIARVELELDDLVVERRVEAARKREECAIGYPLANGDARRRVDARGVARVEKGRRRWKVSPTVCCRTLPTSAEIGLVSAWVARAPSEISLCVWFGSRSARTSGATSVRWTSRQQKREHRRSAGRVGLELEIVHALGRSLNAPTVTRYVCPLNVGPPGLHRTWFRLRCRRTARCGRVDEVDAARDPIPLPSKFASHPIPRGRTARACHMCRAVSGRRWRPAAAGGRHLQRGRHDDLQVEPQGTTGAGGAPTALPPVDCATRSKMFPGVSSRRVHTALLTVTVPPSVGARKFPRTDKSASTVDRIPSG